MYHIGVDLGGTQIRVGLFKQNGELIDKAVQLTMAQEGPAAVITRIKDLIYKVSTGKAQGHITGIGIGSPGPLNPYTGMVLSPANLPGWNRVPLQSIIQQEFSLPVFLNNDANAAVLGEYFYGAEKGIKNLLYITLSTGVGGGVILDGRLLQGAQGSAAEIGHMIIHPDGPACGCGNQGCLEAYASGTGLVNQALTYLKAHPSEQSLLSGYGSALTSKDIFQAAQNGDLVALTIVEESRRYLGIGLANLIQLYNPEKVIFGGGVAKAGDFFLQPAISLARQLAPTGMTETLQFLSSTLGDDVGLLGAASLVAYHTNNSSINLNQEN